MSPNCFYTALTRIICNNRQRRIIKFLEEKDNIESRKQMEDLRQSLFLLAEETNVKQLPFYTPISEARLLKNLQSLGNAMTPLSEKDIVTFSCNGDMLMINKKFNVLPETIEEILTDRIITGQYELLCNSPAASSYRRVNARVCGIPADELKHYNLNCHLISSMLQNFP